MALRILFPGDRHSLSTLAPGAFSRQNFGAVGCTSDRITADTPDGVLAGMVAAYSGNYEVDIYSASTANKPVGIFLNDAAGSPFENTPAVASGKVTVMRSMGTYETDIYETEGVTYNVGDPLYASAFGLLTTSNAADTTVVGRVAKAPSPTDPWLGFDLYV